MLENTKGQSKIDNPEKMTTYDTQDTRRKQTKQKHATACVVHQYM